LRPTGAANPARHQVWGTLRSILGQRSKQCLVHASIKNQIVSGDFRVGQHTPGGKDCGRVEVALIQLDRGCLPAEIRSYVVYKTFMLFNMTDPVPSVWGEPAPRAATSSLEKRNLPSAKVHKHRRKISSTSIASP